MEPQAPHDVSPIDEDDQLIPEPEAIRAANLWLAGVMNAEPHKRPKLFTEGKRVDPNSGEPIQGSGFMVPVEQFDRAGRVYGYVSILDGSLQSGEHTTPIGLVCEEWDNDQSAPQDSAWTRTVRQFDEKGRVIAELQYEPGKPQAREGNCTKCTTFEYPDDIQGFVQVRRFDLQANVPQPNNWKLTGQNEDTINSYVQVANDGRVKPGSSAPHGYRELPA